jgi:hypothetical protein
MKEFHDIHGLRLVVEKEDDCYRALSVVHKLWPQVTGRFKDYILHWKIQGLHITSEIKMGLLSDIRSNALCPFCFVRPCIDLLALGIDHYTLWS